jgi:hypothetical protein
VASKFVECGLIRSEHDVPAGAEGRVDRAGKSDKLGVQVCGSIEGELRRSQISLAGVSETDCR